MEITGHLSNANPSLITIIICTRDRADDLRQTLLSLEDVTIPGECTCELLVIDNGSRDHTSKVIAEIKLSSMTFRPFYEPRHGLSHARNLGLQEAGGDIIVYTDDDLRFTSEWLEEMALPILRLEADAVTGTMRFAPNLERAWMKPMHRVWLAAPPIDSPFLVGTLIGANMAFHRRVLEKVPRFDTELGPGAMGFGDDTLFGHQLVEAGYQIATTSLRTEHHFLPERLTRASFLRHAQNLGKTAAYIGYHWEHQTMRMARVDLLKKTVQLTLWRKMHRKEIATQEGMNINEMHHLRCLHLYGQWLIEQRRPRNYEFRGLVKNSVNLILNS